MIKSIVVTLSGAGLLALTAGSAQAASLAGSGPDGSGPDGAAPRPAATIYVLDQGNGTVVPVLEGIRKVLAPIKVGLPPAGSPSPATGSILLAPGSQRAYVLNPGTSTIAVISTLGCPAVSGQVTRR